jgi:AcrR family transcriptional regulator
MSTATRDRILDEAMRLFGQQGFKATTIVQIETAAGLTPGAGGIYHHFANKEALLAVGVERHLLRLAALRDIRAVFTDLGDARAELTVAARYALAELDQEAELLRLLTAEARNRPELLEHATEQLITATIEGFAGWLAERAAQPLPRERAVALASITLGGLIANRLLQTIFGVAAAVDDEELVAAWTDLVLPILGGD